MKSKLFDDEKTEKQVTVAIAAVVMHGTLAGGQLRQPTHLVDDSFDIAQRFVARAKELFK